MDCETTKKNDDIHFTYKAQCDKSSLCQGDLLRITDDLKSTLEIYHPYFVNEQYQYFMVLTQSCDLVRRGGGNKCKTPYITLAAVRRFDDFFKRLLLENKYAENVNGLLLMDTKNRERAYQLLERIYNNTESDYFFLYEQGELGLSNSMLATLKVSIALKSEEHYEKCLAAKFIELSDEFKAKLGWLVGNIYSRVGTTDWSSIESDSQHNSRLSDELESHCVIGEKQKIKALKTELREHSEQISSIDEAVKYISELHIDSQYDQVISVLEEIINTSSKKIPFEEKEKLISAIKSRQKLKALIPN